MCLQKVHIGSTYGVMYPFNDVLGMGSGVQKVWNGDTVFAESTYLDSIAEVREVAPEVSLDGRTVIITGLIDSDMVIVTDISGKMVYQAVGAEISHTVRLNDPGIYIVKAGSYTSKISVM